MIRRARIEDVDNIMKMIKLTVSQMNFENNNQWDENYPNYEIIKKDIENEDLYIKEFDNDIQGIICINFDEAKEYEELKWECNDKAMVIHRMAVSPNYRNKGLGTKLINFADELAKSNNINYIKSDTYSRNQKMDYLFKKCGFNQIGEVKFEGKDESFYCYEKLIK